MRPSAATLLSLVIVATTFSHQARAEHPICTATGTQDQISVAPGDSSAVVAWRDNRLDPGNPYDIFASRLSYYLNPLWSPFTDGADVCNAAGSQTDAAVAIGSDGTTWMSWRDYRTCSGGKVWVQALTPGGSPVCQVDGILPTNDTACGNWMLSHAIISTTPGTAIVTWHRSWLDVNQVHNQVVAQKINAATCTPQWGAAGVLIQDHGAFFSRIGTIIPSVIADGAGGMIVVWSYGTNSSDVRLYARRVDSAGNVVWASTVRVCATEVLQQNQTIAPDGSGGVIITWQQGAVGARTIVGQRIDANGVVQWGTSGKIIAGSGGGDLTNPQIVRTTLGRSFVVWEADYGASNSDIIAQRVNFLGDTLAARISICGAPYGQTAPRATAGPNGSCYIVWQDGRDLAIGDEADIFAQRLDVSGTQQCRPDGVRIAGLPDTTGETIRQSDPRIATVEIGGSTRFPGAHVLVVWSDTRDGAPDIYGAAMSDSCQPGALAVWPRRVDAGVGSSSSPNPFSVFTKIRFHLAHASPVNLRVYDMSGRLVRVLANSARLEPGEHELPWDGISDAGSRVSPGVYFYRLATEQDTQVNHMVFIK